MIFALEHQRVRLGRFSTAGTYATSPDVYVAVSEEATAITPMNTMFEFVDGVFHASDTRSVNSTFVNGTQIFRRHRLAPGDVIDIGGAPREGGARVVFLGHIAPAGRLVRRAPVRTKFTWSSPRRAVTMNIDAASGTATATLEENDERWHEHALEVSKLDSPRLPPSAIIGSAPVVIEYWFEGPVIAIHPTRELAVAHASAIVASLCEAVAVCHAARPKPIVIGPFERGLVWQRADGDVVLLGAGISRRGFLDANRRGCIGPAALPVHVPLCWEDMLGRATPAADVFYLAYFWFELVFGHEPYPVDSGFEYMLAVGDGRPTLPDIVPAPIARAFCPDPAQRPTLDELAAMFRALAGRRTESV
jgi:hypothetical protein